MHAVSTNQIADILRFNDKVVITDKEKYESAISDSNKLFWLNSIPDKYLNYIINVEKKSKQLLKNLLDNGKSSKDEYGKGSRPGILCDNPKIHQPFIDNLPKSRPNLFAMNIPGCKVVKFLIPIIEPLYS